MSRGPYRPIVCYASKDPADLVTLVLLQDSWRTKHFTPVTADEHSFARTTGRIKKSIVNRSFRLDIRASLVTGHFIYPLYVHKMACTLITKLVETKKNKLADLQMPYSDACVTVPESEGGCEGRTD